MKLVKFSLTVPQAIALWQLAGEGWEGKVIQETASEQLSPVDLRAVAALEDAIEKVRGKFTHRLTERSQ